MVSHGPEKGSWILDELKMKLKGRFQTVSDIQRESQAALDSIKENDFHCSLEAWKKDRIAEYVPKETILKNMATKIE
jgi:phage regulator Rha-like protein